MSPTDYSTGRKQHVRATVEQVIDVVRRHEPVTEVEVAERLNIDHVNARGKLDAAIYRGEVVCDDYSDDGLTLTRPEWRYAMRADR